MAAMIWFGMTVDIYFGRNPLAGIEYPRGRVVDVINDQTSVDENGIRRGRQDLLVEILTGDHRGAVLEVHNMLFIDAPVYAQVGQRVVVALSKDPMSGAYSAHVHTYERATAIYAIILLFLLLLAAVGGKAGIRSAFGLVFTMVTLLFLLIPAIVSGAPPALLTISLSLVIIAVSLIAIMGFEKKTYVSIAGTYVGVGLYGIFYLMSGAALRVSGFNVGEMSSLIVFGFQPAARLSELLFCGILISSLGAITDTTVSVASTTAEISRADKKLDFAGLFRSSMRMARDCVGSTANTLILAFAGAFFITLILFHLHDFEFHMLIHRADIAIEVLRAVTTSAAMVLAAPVTALIGSYAYSSKKQKI